MLDRPVAVEDREWAEVHVRREELLDQRAEGVGLREPRDLIAKLEVLQNVLDVRREAVEIGLEVGLELLLTGAGPEVAQRELRGVVERLAGGLTQRLVLLDDSRFVETGPQIEHGLLARLEHRIEAPQHRHRQDHVAVLAADVEVAQHVVRDTPDEVGDPVELASLQAQILPIFPVLNMTRLVALIPMPGDGTGFNSAIPCCRTTLWGLAVALPFPRHEFGPAMRAESASGTKRSGQFFLRPCADHSSRKQPDRCQRRLNRRMFQVRFSSTCLRIIRRSGQDARTPRDLLRPGVDPASRESSSHALKELSLKVAARFQ